MPYVIGAIVLVGLMCLVNLVLTLGLLHRLREHSALLAGATGTPTSLLLQAGERFGDFTVETLDGATLTAADLRPGTLVGFFSPGCGTCAGDVPRFLRLAREYGRHTQPVAVVVGDNGSSGPMAQALGEVATVVVGQHGDNDVESAFAVNGFPAYCITGGDRTVATGGSLDLVARVPAPA